MGRHRIRVLPGVAAASMALVACAESNSSSERDSTTKAGTSSASGGVAEAGKLVASYRQAPKP
jgi:hypothetical protein